MNLNEIKAPSDKKLFEAIDKENDTGFLTEDLVKVARAKGDNWTEHTAEGFEDHMRKMLGENF